MQRIDDQHHYTANLYIHSFDVRSILRRQLLVTHARIVLCLYILLLLLCVSVFVCMFCRRVRACVCVSRSSKRPIYAN